MRGAIIDESDHSNILRDRYRCDEVRSRDDGEISASIATPRSIKSSTELMARPQLRRI